jgi:hypothetical protein
MSEEIVKLSGLSMRALGRHYSFVNGQIPSAIHPRDVIFMVRLASKDGVRCEQAVVFSEGVFERILNHAQMIAGGRRENVVTLTLGTDDCVVSAGAVATEE